jgi:hypothetical protein
MAKIACAESNDQPTALNKNLDGSVDIGLWQINQPHLNPKLYQPLVNARAAIKLETSQHLSAWKASYHSWHKTLTKTEIRTAQQTSPWITNNPHPQLNPCYPHYPHYPHPPL